MHVTRRTTICATLYHTALVFVASLKSLKSASLSRWYFCSSRISSSFWLRSRILPASSPACVRSFSTLGFVEPTTISRYRRMCEFDWNQPAVLFVERQMEWSPASWDVKVNLPSDGPRVRTTLSPEVTSCWSYLFRKLRDVWRKNWGLKNTPQRQPEFLSSDSPYTSDSSRLTPWLCSDLHHRVKRIIMLYTLFKPLSTHLRP